VNRINIAIALMSVGIAANIAVLVRGEESPGWPIAAIVFLSVAVLALLTERRRQP
jgi:hypothetical protein